MGWVSIDWVRFGVGLSWLDLQRLGPFWELDELGWVCIDWVRFGVSWIGLGMHRLGPFGVRLS